MFVMIFQILFYHLVFVVGLSVQFDFPAGWIRYRGSLLLKTEDHKPNMTDSLNQATVVENTIDKSDLLELFRLKTQYVLKNHIDDFETHFGLHFVPNWTLADRYSSPIRQSVEIRRQKWAHIFSTFNESHAIIRLSSELEKAGVNKSTFCTDIAEIYLLLSDNAYISDDDEPDSAKKRKYAQYFRNLLHEKSIQAFMASVSNSKLGWSKNDEIVQLPKSLYVDLMRKDAHAALIKQHHKEQIRRLKEAYRRRVQKARQSSEYGYVDSKISSEYE